MWHLVIGDNARQGLAIDVKLEAVGEAADQEVKVIWSMRAYLFRFWEKIFNFTNENFLICCIYI